MGLSALKSYLPFASKRAIMNEASDSAGYLPGKFVLDPIKIAQRSDLTLEERVDLESLFRTGKV